MLGPFLTIYYELKIQLIVTEFSATLALESDCKNISLSLSHSRSLFISNSHSGRLTLFITRLTARPPSHNQDWSSAGISARGDVRDIRVLEAHTPRYSLQNPAICPNDDNHTRATIAHIYRVVDVVTHGTDSEIIYDRSHSCHKRRSDLIFIHVYHQLLSVLID